MTVKCIDAKGTSGITKGKEYDVKKSAKGFFLIVNDEKSVMDYLSVRFEVVKPVQSTKSMAKKETSEIIDKAEFSKRLENSTSKIRKEIGSMAKGFIRIGYELYRVREDKLYLGQEYKNVYEYGEKVFGFQKSSVSNYISICERFSILKDNKPTPTLNPAYSNFGYGQLSLMLSLPDEKLPEITPDKTCSEVREIIKDVKIKKELNSKSPAPDNKASAINNKVSAPDSKSIASLETFRVIWDYKGSENKSVNVTVKSGDDMNIHKDILCLLKNDWFDFGRDGDSLRIVGVSK